LNSGEPILNLVYPARRWRKTLESLKIRYRRPYTARHSSVSWNLMLGRNLLWTAKQHGHRTVTMLQTYAAWIDNAVDTDVDQIRRSMGIAPSDPGNIVRANAQPTARIDLSSAPSFRSRLRKIWQQFGQQTERITVEALLFSHQLVRSFAC